MKNTFKEYHKFTDEEFKQLWKNCIFVFDTNTLLNMYRYSRKTVDMYIGVLEEIKSKKQLWIPHQVGYEFYENRIDVIFQFEKSYDEILSIIERARSDIQQKYKNHPFLDLSSIGDEMNKGLAPVVSKIKAKKEEHPKWMEKDEVLEKINKIFEGSIGKGYDEKNIEDIKKEGKDRYEKKIPPGFEDISKPDDKKFGDLIIWHQMIDRAKDLKKPIVLISGDVKKDWWLEKDGKKIMPLPQLKKEMLDKAGVDFHIYTADNFLEMYSSIRAIDEKAIREVRKIRETEEKKSFYALDKSVFVRDIEYKNKDILRDMCFFETVRSLDLIYGLLGRFDSTESESVYLKRKIEFYLKIFKHHEAVNTGLMEDFLLFTKHLMHFLENLVQSERVGSETQSLIEECYQRTKRIQHDSPRYLFTIE